MAIFSIVPLDEINDAERWDAAAFTPHLRRLDQQLRTSPRLGDLATITHASEIQRVYTDAPNGVPFLLAQNIRPILPDLSDTATIPPEVAADIPVNRLQNGDVLVTRSGAFSGIACVYLGETGKCYTSGEGLIVRPSKEIDGAYLAALLNTQTGFTLCRRCLYGSGQPHLAPKYLARTRILRLGDHEASISKLVREAATLIRASAKLYPEAEAELLGRIGWEATEKPCELSYAEDFQTLAERGRFDAEHYQPKYKHLHDQLRQLGAQSIGNLCAPPSRGVQPLYTEGGPILVINSKHLGPTEIDISKAERTTEVFYNRPDVQKARLKKHDVLLYSTGAYVGRTNAWVFDNHAIASNHVTIIRPDTQLCNPIFLALFLNSAAGTAQSEQFAAGSAQRELYPQHICKILVYLPRTKTGQIDLAWQETLANKVLAATRAKAEAKAKLDEAKRLVEQATEKR